MLSSSSWFLGARCLLQFDLWYWWREVLQQTGLLLRSDLVMASLVRILSEYVCLPWVTRTISPSPPLSRIAWTLPPSQRTPRGLPWPWPPPCLDLWLTPQDISFEPPEYRKFGSSLHFHSGEIKKCCEQFGLPNWDFLYLLSVFSRLCFHVSLEDHL